MLGAAWQQGLVPVSLGGADAGDRVERRCGRRRTSRLSPAAASPSPIADFAASLLGPAADGGDAGPDHRAPRRVPHRLSGRRLCRALSRAWSNAFARPRASGAGLAALTTAVARSLFKLMAYKDEYEVARLHMETGLQEKAAAGVRGRLHSQISSGAAVAARGQGRTRPAAEAAIRPMDRAGAFALLARLKFLRGTPFDLFGYSASAGWNEI